MFFSLLPPFSFVLKHFIIFFPEDVKFRKSQSSSHSASVQRSKTSNDRAAWRHQNCSERVKSYRHSSYDWWTWWESTSVYFYLKHEKISRGNFLHMTLTQFSWNYTLSYHVSHFPLKAGTPYENGQFRVQLTLPKDFPANPPKAYFLTKIFHPNVAANGEICVNTLKKDWKSDLGIKHVLLVSDLLISIS